MSASEGRSPDGRLLRQRRGQRVALRLLSVQLEPKPERITEEGDSAGVWLLPRRLIYFSSSLPPKPSAALLSASPQSLQGWLFNPLLPIPRSAAPPTRELHTEVRAPGPDHPAEAASWTGFKGDSA